MAPIFEGTPQLLGERTDRTHADPILDLEERHSPLGGYYRGNDPWSLDPSDSERAKERALGRWAR